MNSIFVMWFYRSKIQIGRRKKTQEMIGILLYTSLRTSKALTKHKDPNWEAQKDYQRHCCRTITNINETPKLVIRFILLSTCYISVVTL